MKKIVIASFFIGITFSSFSQYTTPCISPVFPWYLGGNNLASGSSNVLGTCTNDNFILQANYKKSLLIKTNGYVGIGEYNTNPGAALDVSDGSGGSASPYHMKILGDPYGAIESNTDMHLFYKPGGVFSISEGSYSGAWYPWLHVASGGNVGIGTTSPSSKLTIDATGTNYLQGTSTNGLNILTGTTGYAMAVHNSGGGIFAIWPDGRLAVGNTGSPDYAKLNVNMNASGAAIDVYDRVSTTVNFRVYNSGKTEIGKPLLNTSPYAGTASLTVKGLIVSQEVIVTQSLWSDYVFDKNYKLMPLKELENYYSKNHHLPDVPSTKEVVENGNDLGKTDAMLLQKIEELTLYIVEQQKQLFEQQKEIEKIKHLVK